jgi:outer membrane protein assembly factor BamB
VLVVVAVVVVAGLAAVLWPRDEEPSSSSRTETGGWASGLGRHTYITADDETVCGATSDGVLYCVDAATGVERFTEQLDGTPTGPALVDGAVVVAIRPETRGTEGLFAYSVDGEPLWAAGLAATATYDVELATAAGVVALPVDTPETGTPLVGVDAATGEERWRLYDSEDGPELVAGESVYSDGERFYVGVKSFPDLDVCVDSASEAVSDEVADACATGRLIYQVAAIDGASGAELWRFSLPRTPDFDDLIDLGGVAALGDGSALAVVLGIGPDRLVMLDRVSGELRWEVPLASDYGSVAQVDDVVVVADYDQGIHGYDVAGDLLWSVPSPPSSVDGSEPAILGSLVTEGGRVYSVGFDLYEIDPTDGATRLVGAAASSTDVAVIGDRLVVAGMRGIQVVPRDAELPDFEPTVPPRRPGDDDPPPFSPGD